MIPLGMVLKRRYRPYGRLWYVSSDRLTVTSYVVLGMIAVRGPSTSYELKRAISRSVGYFWPFSHTQLYGEPARLAGQGLLEVSNEESGRRRKTYNLTDQGLHRLRDWISEPTGETFQLRDVAELKLFFSEVASEEDVRSIAEEQIKLHTERLATYQSIRDRYASQPEVRRRMVPLRLGLELEHTAMRFWQSIADEVQSSL
jgi:PadR family transcriptional regulator, regulatory protein AphA